MKNITFGYEPDCLSLAINSGPLTKAEARALAVRLTAILAREFPDAQVYAGPSLTT